VDGVEEDSSTLSSLQGFQQFRMLSVEFHVLLGVDSRAVVDLGSVLPQTLEQIFLFKGQTGSLTPAVHIQKRFVNASFKHHRA
jgi:hypothetical protein